MPPLPLHFARLGSLRERVLWQLLILPIVAALAAWPLLEPLKSIDQFAPYFETLGRLLATPPRKVAEYVLVMLTFCASAAGYLLGWGINFLLLVTARRYSVLEAKDAFWSRRVPPAWEKDDAAQRVQDDRIKNTEEWRWAQQVGAFRYIVVRGGLVLGTFAVLGLHVLLNLVKSQPVALESLPLKFSLWVAFGAALNACRWWALKRASREA